MSNVSFRMDMNKLTCLICLLSVTRADLLMTCFLLCRIQVDSFLTQIHYVPTLNHKNSHWVCVVFTPSGAYLCRMQPSQQKLDMAKRAGRVGFGLGQSGHGSKWVIFKRVNRVVGQTGCGLSWVASRVKLTRIFQKFFFFLGNRCNLPIVYEFLNYN